MNDKYIINLFKVFPRELINLPHWVGWKILTERKIPIDLKTGKWAESNNPLTWTNFNRASQYYTKFSCLGLGFVLQPPFVGIDLDDHIQNPLIDKINSYTEYSPSKTGLHIICKGTIPKAYKKDKIEIYNASRYFTVTGNTLKNPGKIRIITNELDEYFTKDELKGNPPGWVSDVLLDIKDGNIDTTLFRVLSKLRNDGYSDKDAKVLLEPYANQAGATPGHLDEKIKNVWTRYKPKILGDQLLEEIKSNSISEEEPVAISDFLSKIDQVSWVIPSIIAKNSINFFCGLQETCKTWMLIDLAIEASKGGGYWLGKFPVKDCSVLYIDQERAKNETQRRFKALTLAKNLDLKQLRLKIKWGSTIRLDLQHSYTAFKKLLLTQKPDLVLIDSFSTFHTKEENNKKEIQEVLEVLKILRNEVKCTFVFIDHENKLAYNEEELNPSLKTMSGNVAKAACLEGALTLRRKADGESMVYHTKNTQGSKIEPFLVRVTDLNLEKTKISIKAF